MPHQDIVFSRKSNGNDCFTLCGLCRSIAQFVLVKNQFLVDVTTVTIAFVLVIGVIIIIQLIGSVLIVLCRPTGNECTRMETDPFGKR